MSRIIETTDKGQELLTKYKQEVRSLAGVVVEIMLDDPKLLLSPYFREMVGEKAKLSVNYI